MMRPKPAPPLRLHLRLLLPLLALAAALWGVPGCRAQAGQPLTGQGVDPVTLGLVPNSSSVPVWVSVSLEKLEQIDEKGYTFSAVFTIVMTWRGDPRINDTVNLINFVGKDTQAAQQQALKNCTRWATLTGASSNPDCKAALSSPSGDCQKVCFMGNGYACCDNIWLPGFYIANLLYQPQDRIISDQVWLYGATVGGLNGDWGAVYRVVRVQGKFSNAFEFKKFPFDQQVLKFQISPIPPANFHIVPSIVGKSILGVYGFVFQYDGRAFSSSEPRVLSGQSRFSSNEVTGWQFMGNDSQTMRFCCNSKCDNGSSDSTAYTLPNGLNLSDPQLYAYQNLSGEGSKDTPDGLTCSVCIYVSRTSNYYVLNNLIPVLVNSLLSFTVVFARPSDLDIRLSTLVTLFLALVAIQFVIADQLPRTSYATAFGILVLSSYVLIMLLIVESLLVFYVSVLDENYRRKREAINRKKAKLKSRKERGNHSMSPLARAESGASATAESEVGEIVRDTSVDEQRRGHDGEARVSFADEMSDEPSTPTNKAALTRTQTSRFIYRPFMFTEERLLAFFDGTEDAFRIASIIDNMSLAFLLVGYIVSTVVIFVTTPPNPTICTL